MDQVERLNITLEPRQAEKLARLAERMHLQPGTVARSLLSSALDDADPDVRSVVDVLAEVLADQPREVLDGAFLPPGDAVAVVQEQDHGERQA